VHLWVHLILACKWMSKLARLRPPSASQSSLNLGLQLDLQTRSIMASKYIVEELCRVYGDSGVTEVDWAMGSIYAGDCRVDRCHLILIQKKCTLYLSQLLVSLALSEILWIHTIAWILTAGLYHIFSPSPYARWARMAVSHEIRLDVARGVLECWW